MPISVMVEDTGRAPVWARRRRRPLAGLGDLDVGFIATYGGIIVAAGVVWWLLARPRGAVHGLAGYGWYAPPRRRRRRRR